MRKRLFLRFALLAPFLVMATAGYSEEVAQPGADDENQEVLERGSYLVHRVAMCVQCHSPRDKAGDLLRHNLLGGAAIPLQSPFHYQMWAFQAPPLRGLPTGYTEEMLVRLLTQGVGHTGAPPRHPMPAYRFTEQDARAVAAYLKWTETHGEVKDISVQAQAEPNRAIAALLPTEGYTVHGIVEFTEEQGFLHIMADVTGLTPGLHGFHIHENGDCGATDASSAGPHFNPDSQPHGAPGSVSAHAGDLGNLVADERGRAHYESLARLSLEGERSVLGRSIVVHAQMDDLKSQPSGASGPRVACGVITKQK